MDDKYFAIFLLGYHSSHWMREDKKPYYVSSYFCYYFTNLGINVFFFCSMVFCFLIGNLYRLEIILYKLVYIILFERKLVSILKIFIYVI